MRMLLYARSNRLVTLFHSSNKDILHELGRSFCGFVDHFTVLMVTCGHTTKNHRFLKFVLHTTTYIEPFYMALVAAVPVQYLCRIIFLILNV